MSEPVKKCLRIEFSVSKESPLTKEAFKEMCTFDYHADIITFNDDKFIRVMNRDNLSCTLLRFSDVSHEERSRLKIHGNHTEFCGNCKHDFLVCTGKLQSCGDCWKQMCPNCVWKNECPGTYDGITHYMRQCSKYVCDDHTTKCDICDGVSCDDCLMSCQGCEKVVCLKCVFACVSCKKVFCKECSTGFQCALCENFETVCEGCMKRCEKCGDVICVGHTDDFDYSVTKEIGEIEKNLEGFDGCDGCLCQFCGEEKRDEIRKLMKDPLVD